MAIDAKTRGGTKSAACRCLFGRPSPRENGATQTEFRRQMNESLDDKTIEYNFDFRSGLPLEGRWQWQRIRDDDRTSRSTQSEPEVSPLRGKDVEAAAVDPVDSGTESSVSSDSESGVSLDNSPADGAVSDDDVSSGHRRTSKKRQSAMTDHYRLTKRPKHQRESKDASAATSSTSTSSPTSSSSTSSAALSTTTTTASQ